MKHVKHYHYYINQQSEISNRKLAIENTVFMKNIYVKYNLCVLFFLDLKKIEIDF
jgi:hypothetical protein